MALSDFLGGINDSLNNLVADVSPSYSKWLAQDRARVQNAKPAPGASFFRQFAGATSNDMGGAFTALGDIPGFDELMTVLDAPRRGIDTALITAQHSETVGRRTHSSEWAEMFNGSTWARAWDLASFENVTRPTGGAIVTQSFGSTPEFDPLDQAEATKLQEQANDTWYGRTMTTTIDLGTSFVSLPGTGAMARARAASGINTIADAERVAQRFNDVGAVERGLGRKAKDQLHLVVPSGAQNVDALVARQVEGLRAFDGELDQFKNYNALKARLEHAPEGEVSKLANLFTEINKVPDPAVRERLRMNTFLAGLGSATAKRALIEEAPLLAKNFEGMTTTSREAGAFTELYALRLDGPDLPLNEVIDRVWNTSGDKAELAALKGEVKKRRTALSDHNRLVGELRALKPRVLKTPESEHVQLRRAEKHDEVKKLVSELQTAKQDLHGTRRWAAGSVKAGKGVGVIEDAQDFHTALGDARRRVTDLEERLTQARSDRALLDSTPLHDPQAIDDWRSMVDEARLERTGLAADLDAAKAERQGLRDTITAKEHEIGSLSGYLDTANTRIGEILDVAGPDSTMALRGDAKPTALSSLKANIRDQIGGDHYVVAGDGNTIVRLRSLPGRAARQALEPQARGAISLTEVGLGARQLANTMARSKVFSPEEIVKMRSALVRTDPSARVGVVSHVQDEMLQRMATRFYRDKYPDITPEEAVAKATEITGLTKKAWGQGNDWISKSADEQIKDGEVYVRDADGQWVAFDGPSLRSQLADNAPIFDPWDFEHALQRHEKTIAGRAVKTGGTLLHAHDFVVSVWKYGALLRPGLMVRSMLDTGPRALASMTAFESLAATMNGAANVVHNRALKGLAKVHFAGLTPDQAAAKARYLGIKSVNVGGRDFRLASDAAELQTSLSAASKGQTVHGALFHDEVKAYDSLALDRASWKRRKPTSEMWHIAYKEYAGMLLASPTGRKLADLATKTDDIDVAALREEIKASPEFTAEYRKLAQPLGRTRSEFLQQLVHEVDLMFPNDKLLTAARNGGISKKLIDRELPVGSRFEIPSPEMSSLEAGQWARRGQRQLDRVYRVLLDKPDMWLARNPVVSSIYARQVKAEYRALEAQHGKGYEISVREQQLIDSKARSDAIGYVRDTFFDTTRYTGAHRAIARFSPFIAAWEDAMISWGRLIYDDPRRLTKLAAAYHSPYTIATSQQMKLVVDQDGQPIGRGSDADQVSVLLPAPAAKAIAKLFGQDPRHVDEYRVRLDAINSIAQGETWWLPGVGPSVAMAATYALGSGKVISRDAALDLVETDSAMGKAILKSVFLGGEVPAADAKSMTMQTLPGWTRTLATQMFGTGKIQTRQTTFNYLVAEAMANGRTLNDSDYQKLWAQADRAANAAATVRLAMSAGFGMTGSASVDGQFYADQMHIVQAMSDEQRGGLSAEEFFAQKYPEAADLDWSITKNKTGIQARVEASKAETRLAPVLKANPEDIGWMVVGSSNMIDPSLKPGTPEYEQAVKFSRTAYNFQRGDGKRTYQSEADAQQEAQAAVGYRQLNAWSQQIADQLIAGGADPSTVTTSKDYREAKAAIREYLEQTNAAFADSSSKFSNSFEKFYGHALRLSTTGPLKGRSDMATFRDYDAARAEVMQSFGIGSFTGTSPQYAQARAVMTEVGETLAQRDLGFQQMWDRFLEREVQ